MLKNKENDELISRWRYLYFSQLIVWDFEIRQNGGHNRGRNQWYRVMVRNSHILNVTISVQNEDFFKSLFINYLQTFIPFLCISTCFWLRQV
jgi:hypothetical protein